jgi:GntR family transcriptional regulator
MSNREDQHTRLRVRPNVPVAITVANHLRGRLRRDYAGGQRLPSEHLLATELGVSRGTLRQGLAILQHEGLITRKQGLGTFATPPVDGIPARIDFAYEFTDLITSAGYCAQVKTLEIGPACADDEAARRLNVDPGAPMLRVRKQFLADNRPAIYEDDVLPCAAIREDYDPQELEAPIWDFIRNRCRRQIKYVLSELLPVQADAELARLMSVPPGSSLLKFVEVFYDARNEPVVLAHIYYGALLRFHALRKVSPVV